MLRLEIYKSYNRKQQNKIIFTAAVISALTPFTDTIYLPALKSIALDFDTSDALVSLSVSIYLAAVGVSQLVWGPVSDRFGRLNVLYFTLAMYEIITVAIVFSPNIGALIGLRTVQGFLVGSTIISASSIVADVFEPSNRGNAMGNVLGPMLLGPIIAPIIGGVLCQFFSWRSTFIFLAVLNAVAMLCVHLFIPETHHWYILQKKLSGGEKTTVEVIAETSRVSPRQGEDELRDEWDSKSSRDTNEVESSTIQTNQYHDVNDKLAIHNDDHDTVPTAKPKLPYIWSFLFILFDAKLFSTFLFNSFAFAAMFTSLTVLPIYLAQEPYNLSVGIIGLAYLPVGVTMMAGAVIGGALSDLSSKHYSNTPEGRLVYPMLLAMPIALGCVGFGFTLYYGTNISGPLLTQALLGFCQAVLMPSTSSYLTELMPSKAGTVSSVLFFVEFSGAAIIVSFSLIITTAIGVQWFFVILGASCFLSMSIASIQYARAMAYGKIKNVTNVERAEEEAVAA